MEKDKGNKLSKRKKGILILIMVLILLGAITFIVFESINSPFNEVVVNVNGAEFKMSYLLKRMYFDGTETLDTMNSIAAEQVVRRSAVVYVEASDSEIEQYELELMKARTGQSDIGGLKDFLNDIASPAGFTEAELEQLIYTGVLITKMNAYLIDNVQTVDEQVHLYAIIFDSESDLNDAISRLGAGEEFEDLASKLNISAELREKKGNMGWFTRGALEDDLASSVFDEMEVGQISEPFILGEQSYALFYVAEHEDAREVDSDILESMKSKALDNWLENEKALCSIELAEISDEKESWIQWQLQKMHKESGK